MRVMEGRLELRTPDGLPVDAALEAESVQGDGLVTLAGASGTLQTTTGPVDVERKDVRLVGTSVVGLHRAHIAVGVHILKADEVRVDGQPVYLSSTTSSGATIPPWLAVVMAGVAVSAAGALGWRARRRAAAWRGLQLAMENGRYDVVAKEGKRFTRGRNSAEAAILVGTACLRDERAQDALDCLAEPRRWDRVQAASRAYIQAIAYMVLGEAQKARNALAECLRMEPSMRAEARTNPYLAGLLVGRHDGRDSDVS